MQIEKLRFYATPEHNCSYLPGQTAKTLFVDPDIDIDHTGYGLLSDLGFRRSGKHLYRPHCEQCSACISVRVPVESFTPDKRQRRIARKNDHLRASIVLPAFNEEHYALYVKYIEGKHADGDMYPPSEAQYISFLVEGREDTRFVEFRDGDQLVAIAVVDFLDSGLSAVYTFYDPDNKNSLGVYAVLWQIAYAKQHFYSFIYLGYWIKDCRKMSYKLEYRPLQLLINGQWVLCN
ncbi:arginyltransferase [Pokkaliibacter sp. CJK22405]|uniref:arginyltransferase n=1 Tax=Pokkaliibacter sp. CJK22405 TaxID=3384615 RepID=UPI0039854AFC